MRRILSIGGLIALVTTLVTPSAQAMGYSTLPSAWTHVNQLQPDTSYWETDREAVKVGSSTAAPGGRCSCSTPGSSRGRGSSTPPSASPWTAPSRATRHLCSSGTRSRSTRRGRSRGGPLASTGAPSWRRVRRRRAASTTRHWRSATTSSAVRSRRRRTGATGRSRSGCARHRRPIPAQGKVILPSSVYLVVNYNNAPVAPVVGTTYPRPCGTVGEPTVMPPPRQFSGQRQGPRRRRRAHDHSGDPRRRGQAGAHEQRRHDDLRGQVRLAGTAGRSARARREVQLSRQDH